MADTAYAAPTHNTHYLRKGVILTLLLVLAFLAIVALGASHVMQNNTSTVRTHNNETNSGTTQGTDVPSTDTKTRQDRTVPSTSGGESNSILKPQ